MKLAKKLGAGAGLFVAILCIVYSLVWFWISDTIKKEVTYVMADARSREIYILPETWGVSGYPFTPEVMFSGKIYGQGNEIEIPWLYIESLFVNGRPIFIDAPQGLRITKPADPDLWSVDKLSIDGFIPEQIPETLTREDLTAWRQAEGKINIQEFFVQKGMLEIKGKGVLELDEFLQPSAVINARITGHMEFLSWLQEQGYVKTREAMLAATIMGGLSKVDRDSGEQYMDATLTLQNQTLFVGPLRLAFLPTIQWGWRSQPGLLE